MQEKENNHVTSQLCLPPQMVPKQCSNILISLLCCIALEPQHLNSRTRHNSYR